MSDERDDTAQRRLAIMQHPMLRLSTKLVAIRILDLQGLKHGACTKGASGLATDCHVKPETVKHAFKELAKARLLLVVEAKPGQRAHRRIDLDALDAMFTRVPPHPGTTAPGTRVPPHPHPGTTAPGTRVPPHPIYQEHQESTIESTKESVVRARESGAKGLVKTTSVGSEGEPPSRTDRAAKVHADFRVHLASALASLKLAMPRRGPASDSGVFETFWEELVIQLDDQAAAEGALWWTVWERVRAAFFADPKARASGYKPAFIKGGFGSYVQGLAGTGTARSARRSAPKMASAEEFEAEARAADAERQARLASR